MNRAELFDIMGQEPPERTTKHPEGTRKHRPQPAVQSLPEGSETSLEVPQASPMRKNPFEAGPQCVFSDPVVSGYLPSWASSRTLPHVPVRRRNGIPWNTDGEHAAAQIISGNESLSLGIAHKRPLGGFLMTRRQPRVDNPSRTRYSVRKD